MTNEKKHNDPAFPPQFAQDSLGRILAPIPGMSKLEFVSALFLPYFLNSAKNRKLVNNGTPITPVEAAIIKATELLDKLNAPENEKSNLQIVE